MFLRSWLLNAVVHQAAWQAGGVFKDLFSHSTHECPFRTVYGPCQEFCPFNSDYTLNFFVWLSAFQKPTGIKLSCVYVVSKWFESSQYASVLLGDQAAQLKSELSKFTWCFQQQPCLLILCPPGLVSQGKKKKKPCKQCFSSTESQISDASASLSTMTSFRALSVYSCMTMRC